MKSLKNPCGLYGKFNISWNTTFIEMILKRNFLNYVLLGSAPMYNLQYMLKGSHTTVSWSRLRLMLSGTAIRVRFKFILRTLTSGVNNLKGTKQNLWKYSTKFCMATTRKTVVQDELHKFLVKHGLDYSMLDIDDVVLDYVITILEELGSGEDAEENIDVDQFIEMMDAYVPGFGEIASEDIFEWMFQLASNLTGEKTKEKVPSRQRQTSLSDDLLEAITVSPSDVQNANCVREKGKKTKEKEDDEIKLLREMFPAACTMEVTHCLGLAGGDMENAIQLILDRQELGESITQVDEISRKKKTTSVLDDKDLKDTLIARYSYVDADEHKKTFNPLAPKPESKKMVRYLENKIVTTKGEKFTEVKKDEDEDMKKTYVNLKPARKYRFH